MLVASICGLACCNKYWLLNAVKIVNPYYCDPSYYELLFERKKATYA